MSDKQTVLQTVAALPETATWGEITDALLALVARRGSVADFARLYREQITAGQLGEYVDPKADFSLGAVIAELESGESA